MCGIVISEQVQRDEEASKPYGSSLGSTGRSEGDGRDVYLCLLKVCNLLLTFLPLYT